MRWADSTFANNGGADPRRPIGARRVTSLHHDFIRDAGIRVYPLLPGTVSGDFAAAPRGISPPL